MVDNFYCLKANKTSYAMFRVLKGFRAMGKKCRAPGLQGSKNRAPFGHNQCYCLGSKWRKVSSGCMAKISGLPSPIPLIPSHLTNLILRLGSVFTFLSLAPVNVKKRDGRDEAG